MNILSLHDVNGVMVGPWLRGGHYCTIIDHSHPKGYNEFSSLTKFGGDMLMFEPEGEYDLIMAYPVYSHADDLCELALSIKVFAHVAHICEECDVPYMIESPLGILASYYKQPDAIIDFGIKSEDDDIFAELDDECSSVGSSYLWVGGGFKLPTHKCIRKADEFIKHCNTSLRTYAPDGFAKAVYEANK